MRRDQYPNARWPRTLPTHVAHPKPASKLDPVLRANALQLQGMFDQAHFSHEIRALDQLLRRISAGEHHMGLRRALADARQYLIHGQVIHIKGKIDYDKQE